MEAFANVIGVFLGFIMLIFNLIFETIAKILSLVGITFPRRAFRKIIFSMACLATLYLVSALLLVLTHSVSAEIKNSYFSGWAFFTVSIVNILLWLAVFGGVGSQESFSKRVKKADLDGGLFVATMMPILSIILGFYFISATEDFWVEEKKRARIAECENINDETTSLFDKVAKSLKIEDEIADIAGKFLKDVCE